MVDVADRRGRRLRLTSAGRALLARAFPVWRRTHAEIDRLLPGNSVDRLRRDLQALS
jgi:DNA-binding MarR family transcriptional regulator